MTETLAADHSRHRARRRRCCAAARWSRSAPKRSTAWARMRPTRGGGRDVRREGPAAFQSADLPLPRRRRRVRAGGGRMRRARLAAAFWPGPLTLVLPRRPDCPVALLAGAGLDTLAVRVPAHRQRAGAAARGGSAGGGTVGQPVGPGQPDDGGACAGRVGRPHRRGAGQRAVPVGVESTVLDLSGRPAGAAAARRRDGGGDRGADRPGRLASAALADLARRCARPECWCRTTRPALPVRLDAHALRADEALLAFGPPLPGAAVAFNLSASVT